MDKVIAELSNAARTGSRLPWIPAKVCTACNFIEFTTDTRADRACKKCGHSEIINLQWLSASIQILLDYLWGSYVKYFELKRNDPKDPFAANKEGWVVLVISNVIKELILQGVIQDIYHINGGKGAVHASGENFRSLKFAYRLITGKDLEKEIKKVSTAEYRKYEKEIRETRNKLLHTEGKVFSITEETINKAVGITYESISVAAILVNAEVEVKLAER